MTLGSQVTLRLPATLLQRVQRLVPALEAQHQSAMLWGGRLTKMAVLRLCLVRGLEALEAEHGIDPNADDSEREDTPPPAKAAPEPKPEPPPSKPAEPERESRSDENAAALALGSLEPEPEAKVKAPPPEPPAEPEVKPAPVEPSETPPPRPAAIDEDRPETGASAAPGHPEDAPEPAPALEDGTPAAEPSGEDLGNGAEPEVSAESSDTETPAEPSKRSRPRFKGEKREGAADRRETPREDRGRRDADHVKALREARGFSQKQAAGAAGISQGAWSRFEKGRTATMPAKIRALVETWEHDTDAAEPEAPSAGDETADVEPPEFGAAEDCPAGHWYARQPTRTAHLLTEPAAGRFACGLEVTPQSRLYMRTDQTKCERCKKREVGLQALDSMRRREHDEQ